VSVFSNPGSILGRLTDFGRAILSDRYLMKNEQFDDLFKRVANAYGDNASHAQRLYYYMINMWFMPATPILSNGGTSRGMPISCFLNECSDSLNGIVEMWNENVWLASRGGGIGSYWGNLRSIGESVSENGKTSGIIPFIKVMDSMTLAISQGSLRRGSAATYLNISHPEIEEFIDMRRPTGGDPNRRSLNLHHGICITDDFMNAMTRNEDWKLVSPHTGATIRTVRARDLWIRILTTRLETGEPYIIFIDTVNRSIPEHHKKLGLKVKMSNLCSEITLPTGLDHLGKWRTAVCCLSSVNLEMFDSWATCDVFIPDIMRFLDNVLQDFIDRAPSNMSRAVYSASRERSVGLGVMGFHSYLQSKMVPFESAAAKAINLKIFKLIKEQADFVSKELAEERGPCPDASDCGIMERFSNKLSIAPTASISIIAGESSPGIEPYNANVYTHKNLTGSFVVTNKHLTKLLSERGQENNDTIARIAVDNGSVANLNYLDDYEKSIFKTANEINQLWLIEHAADRTPYICQSQSLNCFLTGNVDKTSLHTMHYKAWESGLKSLYYCRSTAVSRADKVSNDPTVFHVTTSPILTEENLELQLNNTSPNQYEECLSCQ